MVTGLKLERMASLSVVGKGLVLHWLEPCTRYVQSLGSERERQTEGGERQTEGGERQVD